MTQLVEKLTEGTGLIATVSAAANFVQHTASMKVPLTSHNRKSTGPLIVSVMGMTKMNQSIEIGKTAVHGAKIGMVVEVESLTVASTGTPPLNVLGRESMTFRGLKRMIDITSIHTVIHLIKVPHAVSLIVIGSTGKKFDLRAAVPGAVSARLQAGCGAPTASAPTAKGLKNFIQSADLREVKPCARESRSRPPAPTARAAPRTGSGPMRKPKGKISVMCAGD